MRCRSTTMRKGNTEICNIPISDQVTFTGHAASPWSVQPKALRDRAEIGCGRASILLLQRRYTLCTFDADGKFTSSDADSSSSGDRRADAARARGKRCSGPQVWLNCHHCGCYFE